MNHAGVGRPTHPLTPISRVEFVSGENDKLKGYSRSLVALLAPVLLVRAAYWRLANVNLLGQQIPQGEDLTRVSPPLVCMRIEAVPGMKS